MSDVNWGREKETCFHCQGSGEVNRIPMICDGEKFIVAGEEYKETCAKCAGNGWLIVPETCRDHGDGTMTIRELERLP